WLRAVACSPAGLSFPVVLSSLFVFYTGFSSVAFRASQPVHGAAETNGAAGLIFFQEAAGTGRQPVGPVVPASTFNYPRFVADQGGESVTASQFALIAYTHNQGASIEIVDHITFLVVAAILAFFVGNSNSFYPAEAVFF